MLANGAPLLSVQAGMYADSLQCHCVKNEQLVLICKAFMSHAPELTQNATFHAVTCMNISDWICLCQDKVLKSLAEDNRTGVTAFMNHTSEASAQHAPVMMLPAVTHWRQPLHVLLCCLHSLASCIVYTRCVTHTAAIM